jgi:hypothetical protein
MFFSQWLNTDEVDAFARALAQDLSGRLPLPAMASGKPLAPARISATREAIAARAVAFARKHKVNWYKKAHLTNTFKWELREAGYDDKFVNSWTYDVAVFLSSKQSKS